jgi:two-component system, NarL family, response regulator LiaR
MRIVVVDDEPDVRTTLRALLEAHTTFTVVGEASNGQEAVELAGKLQPDVVVMDVVMPVMDGLEATREISNRWPDIFVMAYSGDKHVIRDMIEAGAIGYVSKSDTANQLVYFLESIDDRRSVNGGV